MSHSLLFNFQVVLKKISVQTLFSSSLCISCLLLSMSHNNINWKKTDFLKHITDSEFFFNVEILLNFVPRTACFLPLLVLAIGRRASLPYSLVQLPTPCHKVCKCRVRIISQVHGPWIYHYSNVPNDLLALS